MTAFLHTTISYLLRNDSENICFSAHKHLIRVLFPLFYNPHSQSHLKWQKKNKADITLDSGCVLSMNVFHVWNDWGIILPPPTVTENERDWVRGVSSISWDFRSSVFFYAWSGLPVAEPRHVVEMCMWLIMAVSISSLQSLLLLWGLKAIMDVKRTKWCFCVFCLPRLLWLSFAHKQVV